MLGSLSGLVATDKPVTDEHLCELVNASQSCIWLYLCSSISKFCKHIYSIAGQPSRYIVSEEAGCALQFSHALLFLDCAMPLVSGSGTDFKLSDF